MFFKSIPLPGSPSDITVSRDRKWLAVIYTAGGEGYVAVFAIDAYGTEKEHRSLNKQIEFLHNGSGAMSRAREPHGRNARLNRNRTIR